MKTAGKALALLYGLTLGSAALPVDHDEVDLELLEYLGSWGGEDDEWHEFFDSIPGELVEGAGENETTDQRAEHDSD